MPVGLKAPESLLPINGVRLAALHSGIQSNPEKKDLALIEVAESARLAAVFTRNKFCAAPVTLAKKHLAEDQSPRYLLINSGNANAGTGHSGYQAAVQSCQRVALLTGVCETQVLPFSTGVIAAALPVEKIKQVIPALIDQLDEQSWLDAAESMMTTDTLAKAISQTVVINSVMITITGICKGSGMINPDMATMLAYVATDAGIDQKLLQDMLQRAAESSFHRITVDGDTSTNDACVLIATGCSGVTIAAADQDTFMQALTSVFQQLAQSIVRDAEGATKFVEVQVIGAAAAADAKKVAYSVAHSPLVKTALFASDPNWGRILAAIGRAPVKGLDVSRIGLYLGDICLLRNGLPDEHYEEAMGQLEMQKEEIKIQIDLGQGGYQFELWTSDLSHEYVRINAEYRS